MKNETAITHLYQQPTATNRATPEKSQENRKRRPADTVVPARGASTCLVPRQNTSQRAHATNGARERPMRPPGVAIQPLSPVSVNPRQPIRVLHVLGALNPGGIEVWLVKLMRHIDRERIQVDFLVHTVEPAAYDREVRAMGARIISCPNPHRPWSYAREFRRLLRLHGPYRVVHSHLHHFSGWVLRAAALEGVPIRIAQSHSDTTAVDSHANHLRRWLYLRQMRRWISKYATARIAVSRNAGAAVFGRGWESVPGNSIVYCGIDARDFLEQGETDDESERLVSPNAFVIGHVGRFVEPKNHAFLFAVVAEVARREPATRLLLIGDGPLRAQLQAQAEALGIFDRVVFAGQRSDVPRVMKQMDVFVLPSRFEGLPVSGLEAQAAGLPLVISDTITSELDFLPDRVRRLSLTDPVSAWADAVLDARRRKTATGVETALEALESSPFSIGACLRNLEALYYA
jgi:glycosyltransferase involved in cell wall biosynthesis